MLAPFGLIPELAWAAAWIFALGLWITSRDLPLRVALPVTALKAAIPFLYFLRDPNGAMHLADDLQYYHNVLPLFEQGYTLKTILLEPAGIVIVLQLTAGLHFLYNLWNLAAMSAFGPNYFAPVFLNVGATFAAGWSFYRILRLLGFGRAYRRGALVFFLLHWDVLTWSSFFNLKDPLVLVLSVAILHGLLILFERPRPGLLAWVLVLLGLLTILRFYAPLLILAALFLRLVFGRGMRGRLVPGIVFVAAISGVSLLVFRPALGALGHVQPLEMLWGLPRFLLTPLPWKLAEGYGFLFPSSILHLLLIVPALVAAFVLWGRSGAARFLLTYGALVLILYAAVPYLQGPRHRLQIGFLIAWLQFHGVWLLARYAVASPAPPRDPVPAAEPSAEAG